MKDRTAAQRWNSRDTCPGSAFHEIVVVPTLMPEATRPFEWPGLQPGASGLDPWMQTGLQSLPNAQGLYPALILQLLTGFAQSRKPPTFAATTSS